MSSDCGRVANVHFHVLPLAPVEQLELSSHGAVPDALLDETPVAAPSHAGPSHLLPGKGAEHEGEQVPGGENVQDGGNKADDATGGEEYRGHLQDDKLVVRELEQEVREGFVGPGPDSFVAAPGVRAA